MGILILYIVSLILFWIATLILPLFFVPLGWLIKSITQDKIPSIRILFFNTVIITILLLYLTKYIWGQLGYEIGWFPVVLGFQNLFASQNPYANAASKNDYWAEVIACLIFLILNVLL